MRHFASPTKSYTVPRTFSPYINPSRIFDIPTEKTAVILTNDFFRNIKTLPIALVKICLDTVFTSYPNLMMTDITLMEATGNVFNPIDRMIRSWVERYSVKISTTQIGVRLKNGQVSLEIAAELSIEEAALLCPPATKAYRIDGDGRSWFRFRPVEVADLNIPSMRGGFYLPHKTSYTMLNNNQQGNKPRTYEPKKHVTLVDQSSSYKTIHPDILAAKTEASSIQKLHQPFISKRVEKEKKTSFPSMLKPVISFFKTGLAKLTQIHSGLSKPARAYSIYSRS